uniref:Putative mitochondrial thymidine kinase 2/deoxyguanosine kinase n=1 Tax=Ixodes ricinus TaxID=34613 RepID=A0A147BTE3_IXORI
MFIPKVVKELIRTPRPLRLLDVLRDATLKNSAEKGQQVTIAVEGNIGSGKTTFLESCRLFTDATVLIEPVSTWRDLNGKNLLALMYREPKRWSLAFQTYVQLTMLQLHLAPVQSAVRLMERSLQSARYVFVENLLQSGLMDPLEHSILDQWFQWIVQNERVALDLVVYLRTEPEVAMERIRHRKRPEEDQISLAWLRQVHTLHDSWLLGRSRFPLPPRVLVIDANRDSIDVHHELARRVPEVLGAGCVAATPWLGF